jgi:phenylacetate-CoA ligase
LRQNGGAAASQIQRIAALSEPLTGPAFLDLLLRSERLDEEAFRANQLRLLERLCRDAASFVGHYNQSLRPLFSQGNPHMGSFLAAAWQDLAPVSKADILKNPKAFHSRSRRQEATTFRESHTSGSSGEPFHYRKSILVDQATTAVANRAFDHFALERGGDLADIRVMLAGPDHRQGGDAAKTWNFSPGSGAHHFFEIRRPVEEQWRWLKEVRPQYLLTYPSNLQRLARCAQADPDHGLSLAACIASAEILPPNVEDLIRSVFDAPVINIYGLREFGHMATSCPQTGDLHVAADVTMIEVLDEAGKPVELGETGEVVATSFYNYAMPFIRYATGDFAELGGPCPCGRVLPVLKRILGRRRNRFTLAGGRIAWPIVELGELTALFSIGDYQIVQSETARFEFHYAGAADGQPLDRDAVAAYLRQRLASDVHVDFVLQDAISPSGYAKQERYISRLNQ